MKSVRNISPWLWVPTLYFAEGIPYFIVNSISVIMFKKLGMGNADIALYTGLLYLPWVIKPFWSPFVDIIRTKRWWILTAQAVITIALLIAAFSVPNGAAGIFSKAGAAASSTEAAGGGVSAFMLTLTVFWITAFASATHDIAADGFYMLALDGGTQSLFIGIRSLFYRLSSVFGQGVLVVVAGLLETRTGNIPFAWTLTLLLGSLIFAAITLYHAFFLPRPATDSGKFGAELPVSARDCNGGAARPGDETPNTVRPGDETPNTARPGTETPNTARFGDEIPNTARLGTETSNAAGLWEQSKTVFREFGRTFATFFRKKGIVAALLFMLLFRLPEALLLKMLNPFLLDPVSVGGLGLSTESVGVVYGTVGVLALILGGILGGMAASRWGLKKALLPMALCVALPCVVYVFLAVVQPARLWVIDFCVALDQFGYGFGFTAYMLYMMYWSEGEFKTAHYSLCTAFMALSMMLPGMVAGRLEEWLGYRGFFILVVACCLVTIAVTLCLKVDPGYGKYSDAEKALKQSHPDE